MQLKNLSSLRKRRGSLVPARQRCIGLVERLEDRRLMAGFENFDGVTAPALPSGWVQTATQSNTWTTVANTSDTAPNHAFVANSTVVSESILTSPSFVLPAATPILQFRNNFATEADFDGGVLEISINGGAFADVITAGGIFIAGGYVSTLQTGSGNPIQGRAAWSGNSNGYITTTVNLPATATNQNVVLRWRFGTDESVSQTGWRIDTITLEALPTDDFGDAPAPYPVTLAENGARHTVGALRLGTLIDAENDGSHSAGADFDGTDEDGVTINGGFVIGTEKTILVAASQAGLLNAWIDWNADGDWADENEKVFTNRALVAGANALTVNVPAGLSPSPTVARFRLSSAAGLGFVGPASDGEVEDYFVNISQPGNWTPLGPFSATNGQVEGIVNRPVVGAIHAVLAHPTNADIIYIGSVNGGVWKSTNATSTQPHWTPLTDSMPSQSIGSLAFDLADTTSNTIYAGVGRYGSFGQIGNTRTGLMRSTNGGQTWQVVDGGGLLRGKNISGIYANGDIVVVSVNVADSFTFSNIGIFRSINGGNTFTQISTDTGATTGLPGGVSYDLISDPITPSTLYTSTVFSDLVGGVNGVYKSMDSGATWARVSTAPINSLITNNTSNLELAAGRNNEVYAAIINAGNMAGLFRSPDNGTTWVQMDSPKTNENGIDVGLNPSGGKGPQSGAPEAIAGGQGNIHFSIVADPTDANIVYVGGDRQPRANGDTGGFPNSIGANDFSGRLFRGDASQSAGSQFVHLTHRNNVAALPGGGTASSSSPHADSREMTFDANGNIIEVDDGGVYRRTSPQTNTGDWFSVNGDLQITEAHDVGWDSLSNVALSGNQDTGTTFQPSAGASTWVSISTGDGGDITIDNLERAANNQSVRYTSFQNLGGFRRTIWNANGTLQSTSFPALTPLNGAPSIAGAFRTPVETNAVAGGRLIILGSNGLYESLNGGSSVSRIGTTGVNNISSNALSYGGVQNNVVNPDVVWAGIGNDVFVRTAGTGSVSLVGSDPTTSTIRDLAVNSRDWANAFVIDNNQVFQTSDAGNSWVDITGNSFAVGTDFRSIAFVAGPLSSAVVLGTNVGMFIMSTLQPSIWTPLGSGLPTVLAYDIDYDPVDDVIVVGTLGRGAWILREVTTFLKVPATVVDRGIFYNGSTGNSGNAIASDKRALLPGQSSTFQNYTNFDLGITGISVDVKNLPTSVTPAQMLNSLQFARWNGIDAAGFTPLPNGVSASVTAIQAGAGADGSSRVLITFPNNSLRNTWLRVTVVANSTNILTQNDVFYFGNVVGDVNVGNTATRLRVNAEDTATIRLNQSPLPGSAAAINVYDINRDGRVDAQDTFLVRSNQQPLGIVAPLAAPGPSIPSVPQLLTAPAVLASAFGLPKTTRNRLDRIDLSIGSGKAATTIDTRLVPPDPAPAVELPTVDVAYWYPPMDSFPSPAVENRKHRFVDDYFATL
jgi:GEVED domain